MDKNKLKKEFVSKIYSEFKGKYRDEEILSMMVEIFSKLNCLPKDITELLKKESVVEALDNKLKINLEEKRLRNALMILLDYYHECNEIEELYEEFCNFFNDLLKRRSVQTDDYINTIVTNIFGDISYSVFHDPCAGWGKTIRRISKDNNNVKFLCQELNPNSCRILETRLKFLNVDYEIAEGSVITEPHFLGKQRYDYAFCDWPYGMTISKEEIEYLNNSSDIYLHGMPSIASSVYIPLQQILYSLTNKGKAIIVVPEGILFKEGKDENVRKSIINMDIIESIIQLPANIYNHTSVRLNLIVINKNKKNMDYIQFINQQNMPKTENELNEEIQTLVEVYNTKKEIDGYSKNVAIHNIKNANLSCNKYVYKNEKIISTNYFNNIKIELQEIESTLNNNRKTNLGNVAAAIRGINIVKSENEESGKYSILNMSALKDSKINYNDIIKSDLKRFTNVQNCLIKKDDILISAKGEAIKIALVDKNVENYTVTQSTLILRPYDAKNAKYLFYYLDSPIGRYLIESVQKGAFIPMISAKDLQEIEVLMLPEQEQEEMVYEYEQKNLYLEMEIAKIQKELENNRKKFYERMKIGNVYRKIKEE